MHPPWSDFAPPRVKKENLPYNDRKCKKCEVFLHTLGDYDLTTIDFHILLVYALFCNFCKSKRMSSEFRYCAKSAKIRRFKA